VSFQEYVDPDRQAKVDNKQTADFTKSHTVVEGETLDALASVYYGDATLWRPIAIANGVFDPSRLAGGSRLLIPSLPYRDPDTGQTVN
jgi:nucleoid-associated protein YgaU